MKKILPINVNPYIRTYTHHGYLHSIISAHDKVPYNEIDEVACIEIENFSKYSWSSQIEGLHYDTCESNTIKFYGNKWNIDMKAAFWRKCNSFDEIEICINKQLYTNVWASIYLFLSSNTKLSMTTFDKAYHLEFGNFSKDGIYYKDDKPPYTILLSSPIYPLTIRLVKEESNIILIYKDTNKNENKLTLNINKFKGPNERIGVGVNLRSNSYYEWLFSNYINVYVNHNDVMPIDFLCNKHKNWNYNTYNPFIDFNIISESELPIIGYTLIDYIKKNIDLNKYVEIMINDNIHFKIYCEDYFHQDLIYGYNDIEGCFYILCYKNGKINSIPMPYEDFVSERNEMKNRMVYTYNYNQAYENYRMSPEHILQVFKEYRSSQNISYYEFYYDNNYQFGINGITSLLSKSGQEILLTDIRVSHLLYEHCKCNHDRIEYLHYRKFIDIIDYEKISVLTQKACKRMLVIRNLILKKMCGGNTNNDTIMSYFKDYIALETELTDEIIQAIKKCLSKKNS